MVANMHVRRLRAASFVCFAGGQTYKSPGTVLVEGDASSASYFLTGAAITGGSVTVEGCGTDSLQGDVNYARVLELMGAKVREELKKTRDCWLWFGL